MVATLPQPVTIDGASGDILLTDDIVATDLTAVVSTADGLQLGQLLAFSVGTSTCEVRKVTGIAGTTVTLSAAFKWTHAIGDLVKTTGFWVPAIWWGAVPGDSTVDSYQNLQNMFLDWFNGGGSAAYRGFQGEGTDAKSFYSSRPLWAPDKTWVKDFGVIAYVPFGFDCTDSVWTYDSFPQQHFFYASGQMGTITSVDAAANTITLSTSPGAVEGEPIAFFVGGQDGDDGVLPSPLVVGKTYYCKTYSGANKTVTLSPDKWGTTTIDITTTGSGEVSWGSPGNCKFHADGFWLGGRGSPGNIRGLSGFRGTLQQSSRMRSCWFEKFAGWGATIDGQQSVWYDPVIFDNARGGLRIGGGKFIYLFGGNYEANDINVEFLDMAFSSPPGTAATSGGARNNLIVGGHFESPGSISHLVQTIKKTSVPTAGTWTLNGQTLNWNASSSDVQTACDTAFGSSNVVVTGGPLPGTNIVLTFQGIYQYGWGPTVTITNSITGGSYSVSTVNPDGRQISHKGGLGIRVSDCVDSSSTNPADGLAMAFYTVEGAAAGVNYATNGGYTLQNITTLSSTGNWIVDPNRQTLTRADSTALGLAGNLPLLVAADRHGGSVSRPVWFTGDGNRYMALGFAGAAGIELGGASSQTSPFIKLLPGSSQSGNPIESYNTAGVLKYAVDVNGAIATVAVRPGLVAPAYSASITPDSRAGEWQTITVTDAIAFAINAPTNPPSASQSQSLTIEVLNSSGGAMGAITWNAAFVFAGLSWTNPANTLKRFASFRWNGAKWMAIAVAGADY